MMNISVIANERSECGNLFILVESLPRAFSARNDGAIRRSENVNA